MPQYLIKWFLQVKDITICLWCDACVWRHLGIWHHRGHISQKHNIIYHHGENVALACNWFKGWQCWVSSHGSILNAEYKDPNKDLQYTYQFIGTVGAVMVDEQCFPEILNLFWSRDFS